MKANSKEVEGLVEKAVDTITSIHDMSPEERKTACEAELNPILVKYGQRFDIRIVPQLIMIDIETEKKLQSNKTESKNENEVTETK